MKKAVYTGFILYLMLLLCPSIWAQSRDIEIDGLIMDQTKTKVGHDFAHNFSLTWETAETGYNMIITDQADPLRGSWILIKVNDILVFKALLKPNTDAIKALVAEAVTDCNNFLFNRSLQFEELEPDLKGSGI
jgi:curli production assembly/transport component CsgE